MRDWTNYLWNVTRKLNFEIIVVVTSWHLLHYYWAQYERVVSVITHSTAIILCYWAIKYPDSKIEYFSCNCQRRNHDTKLNILLIWYFVEIFPVVSFDIDGICKWKLKYHSNLMLFMIKELFKFTDQDWTCSR